MKYMIAWKIPPGSYKPAIESFLKSGAPAPPGLKNKVCSGNFARSSFVASTHTACAARRSSGVASARSSSRMNEEYFRYAAWYAGFPASTAASIRRLRPSNPPFLQGSK